MGSSDTAAGAAKPPPGAAPRTNRKTYTVSKAREKWTDEEHAAFIQALENRGESLSGRGVGLGTGRDGRIYSGILRCSARLDSVPLLSSVGRNWKAIVQDIGTRTVAQVRYFCTAKLTIPRCVIGCRPRNITSTCGVPAGPQPRTEIFPSSRKGRAGDGDTAAATKEACLSPISSAGTNSVCVPDTAAGAAESKESWQG
jgi:Myb-like DNA-binding domain